MALSKRASAFLQGSTREGIRLTEVGIRQTFIDNDVTVFDPLIGFQLNYGGYVFAAGLEPITLRSGSWHTKRHHQYVS